MIETLLLNRYELLEKIGEGGMGSVYKAKCHLLNRFVAVKVLKTEFSKDEDFVARFKREASAASSVSHPNIVNVYDVGEENGINFIVMEYIQGKTLKEVIKENIRLNACNTIDIALQIAKALQCAHKNNIIHRDIKPDNIMITDDNIVKVMDFGIAKMADSHTKTSSNKVMGSVHYFSPEQAKGLVVDCRTDIYSLGIVMYEMVTGKVPFDAESSISIAMMHIQQPIILPKKIITDLPEPVNKVILKAVEKEPINRFQTSEEMVQAINIIKEELDFNKNLNKRSNSATKLMDEVVFNEKPTIKRDKKIIIIISTILLAMIMIGVIGKYLSKGSTQNQLNTTNTVSKASAPKVIKQSPSETKKAMPSFIGKTQDIAEKILVSNELSIGDITNEYSDSITKGLVIRQTPEASTFFDKGGKVDLVISQGQKVAPVTLPELKEKIEKRVENHKKGTGKPR